MIHADRVTTRIIVRPAGPGAAEQVVRNGVPQVAAVTSSQSEAQR